MAEKVIEKLDEQLDCSICLDTYTDPKLLQCFHIYCTKCIIPLVRDREGQLTLTCPACRQVTPIPPNGVRGLQSAFQINNFIGIRDDLKKLKDLIPSQEPVVEGDATSQTPSKKTIHYCSEHAGKELDFYCETCDELICYRCISKGSKHHDHDYDPLDEAFDKYKGEITSSLEPMEKIIHTALARLDTRSENISDQRVTIEDDLKKVKDPIPSQESGVEGDETSQTSSIKTIQYCSEHADREFELYCETCNKLICYKCVTKGGKHRDHDYDLLDEAFGKYKGEIASSLEPMEKQLKAIHTALAQLDTHSEEISDQGVTIEASIHDTIRRLHEVLDARKTELIGQLHQMVQRKLRDIAIQRDQMETIQAQLNSCLHFVTDSLKTGSQGQGLKMKTAIVKQVKELTTPFQAHLLKPSTEADITFSTSLGATMQCQQYGKISSPGLPDPSQCHATGESQEVAVVGEKSSVILHAVNYYGAPYEEPIQSLQCELVSEITHATVRGSLERIGKSQYEINYQPTIKGKHQLRIKVEDQHIRGSPFLVTVKLPIEKLGTPIPTIPSPVSPDPSRYHVPGKVLEVAMGAWVSCQSSRKIPY